MSSLYLVRHAIAAERSTTDWPDDTKRPLTQKGASRMREVVRGLVALDIELDLIITSPLVRAKQTADLIVAGWPKTPALIVSASLAPGERPEAVTEELAKHTRADHIALVGHEPALGILAGWLIGAREPLVFKKGGVACINVKTIPITGPGQLVWLATPRMLRGLGTE
jgi:phosphohistidine phosphatase